MTAMWRPIALSARQIKATDRVGGCELILPWPDGLALGSGQALALDQERDATPAEHAAAEQIVRQAADA